MSVSPDLKERTKPLKMLAIMPAENNSVVSSQEFVKALQKDKEKRKQLLGYLSEKRQLKMREEAVKIMENNRQE